MESEPLGRRERWEQRTAPVLTCFAVASLLLFVLDDAWEIDPPYLNALDLLIWATFLVDYLVRLWLSTARLRFVRTHPLDLLAVVLPALRVLRLVAVLGRIVVAAQRGRAEQLILSTSLVVMTLVVGGAAAVEQAERNAPGRTIRGYGDALWWALTTVTTVGYGDCYPVTEEGRLVGAVLMIVGVGAMATVTAAVASQVIHTDRAEVTAEEKAVEAVKDAADDTAAAVDQAAVIERLDRLEHLLTGLTDRRTGPPGRSGD